MTEIVCAVIAGIATVLCAWIAKTNAKTEKERKAADEKTAKLNEQRAKEARLQLSMIAANSKLTVGVAMALKNGHTNGEVEEGLAAVNAANTKYTEFLEEIAIEHMNKTNTTNV